MPVFAAGAALPTTIPTTRYGIAGTVNDSAYLDAFHRILASYRGLDRDALLAETARRRRAAATTIVIQATEEGGTWNVGEEGSPRAFTPRGGGMAALCVLLKAPGKPFLASFLDASHPDTEDGARAVCAQLRRTVSELSRTDRCFDFLLTRVSVHCKTRVVYRAGDPTIVVVDSVRDRAAEAPA